MLSSRVQNERSLGMQQLDDSIEKLDLELENISVRFYIGFLIISAIMNVFHFFIG